MHTGSGRSVDGYVLNTRSSAKNEGFEERRMEYNSHHRGQMSKCARGIQQGCQAVRVHIRGFCGSFEVKPRNANYIRDFLPVGTK